MEAMSMIAAQHLKDFPSAKSITMLFMPTFKSSSKPHLARTNDERVAALNVYCEMLKEIYTDTRIKFEVSTIEKDTSSSATIFTLEALKTQYPEAKITLAMGFDNLLDLPFWVRVNEYKTIIQHLYVPQRKLTPAEIATTNEMRVNDVDLRFNTFASWDSAQKTSLATKNVPEILEGITITLLGTPSPTSSTMLRYAIKVGNKEAFQKLTGLEIDSPEAGRWLAMAPGIVAGQQDEATKASPSNPEEYIAAKDAKAAAELNTFLGQGGGYRKRQRKSRRRKSKRSRSRRA
jgi:nicotinic acid mononucleotide adenylyltransferase